MMDGYFKRPVFWDYCIAIIAVTICKVLLCYGKINLPAETKILSISSDISGIGFTSAGFIITLVTVLITFKSGSKVKKDNYNSSNSVFELFFASDLYFETVKHLKNCIKSLIVLSVLGYALKLFINHNIKEILFLFCISGILIVALTLWRCLLIMTKILNLQKEE